MTQPATDHAWEAERPARRHFHETARRLIVNPRTSRGERATLTALHIEALAIDAEATRRGCPGHGPGRQVYHCDGRCQQPIHRRTGSRPQAVLAPQFHPVALNGPAGTVGTLPSGDLAALAGYVEQRDAASDEQLRAWFSARGVPDRALQLYVGQNRGKTLDELDAEYERMHGPIA